MVALTQRPIVETLLRSKILASEMVYLGPGNA